MARTRQPEEEKPIAEQVKEHANKPVKTAKTRVIDRNRLVPSGSTLLNLACSDTIHGAFLLGEFTNIVGGFSTGKTSGSLEVFAACAQLQRFDDYRFIFDEPERSNEFDMEKQYGKRVAARVEPPVRNKDGEPIHSRTVEDFEINLRRAIKGDRPVIYVLDSFDALTSEQEIKKSDAKIGKADRKKSGEETEKDKQKQAGSYGMEKAKGSSSLFRLVTQDLKDTRSTLIVISQTRQEIDPMKQAKYRRNGGDALDFYAQHVIWLATIEKIKDPVYKRELGNWILAKVDKNKATGKKRKIEYPSYVGYGIDDIDSMLQFLIENEKLTKNPIGWEDETWKRKELIRHIEEDSKRVAELRRMTGDLWHEIEESIKLERVPKYK